MVNLSQENMVKRLLGVTGEYHFYIAYCVRCHADCNNSQGMRHSGYLEKSCSNGSKCNSRFWEHQVSAA